MVRCFLSWICLAWAALGQTASFSSKLYPILKEAGCAACHNSNGVASATRLHFPDAEATQERIEAFGYSLVKLVDRDHPDDSLLLKKPTTARPAHRWIAHKARQSGRGGSQSLDPKAGDAVRRSTRESAEI